MDKMQKSMATYVKSLSKRAEGDDKEKQLPGGHLGSTMVTHGEDFEPDSEFGNCLSGACPEHGAPYTSNSQQPWVAQTSGWPACRRHMLRVPLRHGSRVLSARSSR
jgi:hypothetical protein